MSKQTAVEWYRNTFFKALQEGFITSESEIFEQAKAMEREEMDKVAGDWWNEGASYMHDGKRKYETFEQYYTETYKQ